MLPYLANGLIFKVVPPPYRGPAEAAVNIASFATPGGAARGAAGAGAKIVANVSKPEKQVKNVFGNSWTKSTASFGNDQHKKFMVQMSDGKPPRLDYSDGRYGIPDAMTQTHVMELKPNNPAGIRKGLRQLQKYSDASGLDGQLWVYNEKLGNFKLYDVVKPR